MNLSSSHTHSTVQLSENKTLPEFFQEQKYKLPPYLWFMPQTGPECLIKPCHILKQLKPIKCKWDSLPGNSNSLESRGHLGTEKLLFRMVTFKARGFGVGSEGQDSKTGCGWWGGRHLCKHKLSLLGRRQMTKDQVADADSDYKHFIKLYKGLLYNINHSYSVI